MFNDQRKSRRRPISYAAWIALESGQMHGCVLSDVSETGARIAVEDSKTVPDRFVLLLSGNGSARRPCNVVWREPHQVGVRFRHNKVDRKKASAMLNRVVLGDTDKQAPPAAAGPVENE
jgi:hypothetical protein